MREEQKLFVYDLNQSCLRENCKNDSPIYLNRGLHRGTSTSSLESNLQFRQQRGWWQPFWKPLKQTAALHFDTDTWIHE